MFLSRCSIFFTKTPAFIKGGLFVGFLLLSLSSCTTQDFEYEGKNKDIFRIKIFNKSDQDINYTPQVSLYYLLDGKKNLDLQSGVIAPGDTVLVAESDEGAVGASIDIPFTPELATLQLILEKGRKNGVNTQFKKVRAAERKYVVTIRYGEYY